MAKQEEKGNKILKILTTEYPIDRILVVIMGLLVTVVGYYLVSQHQTPAGQVYLQITNTDAWYTKWIFGSDTGILIFSIFILVMGVGALGLGLYPYFKPSFKEMKRVTWPNATVIKNHSGRVFGFILFLMAVFIVYNAGLTPFFEWLKS